MLEDEPSDERTDVQRQILLIDNGELNGQADNTGALSVKMSVSRSVRLGPTGGLIPTEVEKIPNNKGAQFLRASP